jgi:hypothetical protein
MKTVRALICLALLAAIIDYWRGAPVGGDLKPASWSRP